MNGFFFISQSELVCLALVGEVGLARLINVLRSFDIPVESGENDKLK